MPEPTKIPRPFADSGDKNSIPDSSGSIGFASWQEGFPAITSEPFAQGGVAPKRADFNGIFNALSAATVWNQQGGVYAYDSTTDYEVGNVVEYNNDLYKCITANGPSSAVKDPTDATVWSKVMTSADTAAAYLSLSGGTLSGNLNFSTTSTYIEKTNTNGTLALYAGNNIGTGAEIVLYGKDYASAPGEFQIRAKDGINTKVLRGYPNGTLTWGGNNVITSEGGTIGGTLTFTPANSTYLIRRADTSGVLTIVGGDSGQAAAGAKLYLRGSSYSSSPGAFTLQAGDSNGYKQLTGLPDGKLTWNGDDVLVTPGYYSDEFATKSVPNNTITNLGSFTLTKGLYLVYLTAAFANNTTGYRQLHLATSATGSSLNRYCSFIFAPCASTGTGKVSLLLQVTAASATYYINAYQNSGASLNVSVAGYQYMKIRGY